MGERVSSGRGSSRLSGEGEKGGDGYVSKGGRELREELMWKGGSAIRKIEKGGRKILPGKKGTAELVEEKSKRGGTGLKNLI